MSGPKSSYYDVTAEQRRRLAEERRRREEEERRRRAEQERRRREEEERRRREEIARQNCIWQSDAVIDKAFANLQVATDKQKNSSAPKKSADENFDGREFLNRLNELLSDARLSTSLHDKAAQTKKIFEGITDSTFRKNFAALNIIPLAKECDAYFKLYDEIAALKIEYGVVCEMAGEPEKTFDVSPTTIKNIKDETARLREKTARDDEKFYIGKCLDEVMRDMGYDVIGRRAVTKKSGKHFESEFFSYADGTAVNVTVADDGHIAMELCGLDAVDRLPDDLESERLCGYMENFCEDFGEIERRLAEKGVVLRNRIQRLPPNVEYAQILNVSDYEMNGEVEHFNHRKRHEKTSQPLQRRT